MRGESEGVCLSLRTHNTSECVPGQIVGFGVGLVQESICCDTADQKDESQRGAAETDGRGDTRTHADTWLLIKCHQTLEGRDERRVCVSCLCV